MSRHNSQWGNWLVVTFSYITWNGLVMNQCYELLTPAVMRELRMAAKLLIYCLMCIPILTSWYELWVVTDIIGLWIQVGETNFSLRGWGGSYSRAASPPRQKKLHEVILTRDTPRWGVLNMSCWEEALGQTQDICWIGYCSRLAYM